MKTYNLLPISCFCSAESKCRLINESKIQVGRISKDKLRNNQWRNTPQVVSWFKKLKHKENQSFIEFDILEPKP